MKVRLAVVLVLAIVAGPAAVVGAQLPNASPAAMGLGGAYTAMAKGYDAVAWNPANLAMPGNPAFSLTLLAVNAAPGLDPISYNTLAPYSGKTLPSSARTQWLQSVQSASGENLGSNLGVTEFAMSAGPFALQIGTSVDARATLGPGLAQALLFGNAGRTGSVETINFAGSGVHVGVATTAGLSYGRTIVKSGARHVSVGATFKYTVGNFLAMAQDNGSVADSSSVTVKFPMVYSNPDSSVFVGKGYGLDLGLSWTEGSVTYGMAVKNVLNTFAWDASHLTAKAGTAFFDGTTNTTDFNDAAYSTAPQSLRDRVANDSYKPVVSTGLAYAWKKNTTLSFDAMQMAAGGISTLPQTQVGGGIEFRGIPLLALRAGGAYITGGWNAGGGLSLHLGPFQMGVGAALTDRNGGQSPTVNLNVLSVR